MKASIEIELVPFQAPNFVLIKREPKPRQEGMGNPGEGSIPLSELDSFTLDRLCSEFYNEVFRKAGKSPPPRCA